MKFKLIFYMLILDVFFLCGILSAFGVSWYWLILSVLPILVFLVLACSRIQWNFFLKGIHSGNSTQNKIALTFDDGPHPVYTPQVLDFLDKHSIKATFFCIGKNVKQYPYLVERIIKEGHTIGNHSFSHSNFIDFKNKNGWLKEIEATDLEIQKITGQKPRFFRPPFGVTTPHLARAIKKTQHLVIGWNVRSFDTRNLPAEKIVRKISPKIQAGSIILLHDRHERILPILEQLLPEIAQKNLSFTTINELINEKPYF